MAGKKITYIDMELEFAEQQLALWKKVIEDNPMDQLKDRQTGPKTVQPIENQRKSLEELLKNYLLLLQQVDGMRSAEAQKLELRGKAELNLEQEEFLKNRKG